MISFTSRFNKKHGVAVKTALVSKITFSSAEFRDRFDFAMSC